MSSGVFKIQGDWNQAKYNLPLSATVGCLSEGQKSDWKLSLILLSSRCEVDEETGHGCGCIPVLRRDDTAANRPLCGYEASGSIMKRTPLPRP